MGVAESWNHRALGHQPNWNLHRDTFRIFSSTWTAAANGDALDWSLNGRPSVNNFDTDCHSGVFIPLRSDLYLFWVCFNAVALSNPSTLVVLLFFVFFWISFSWDSVPVEQMFQCEVASPLCCHQSWLPFINWGVDNADVIFCGRDVFLNCLSSFSSVVQPMIFWFFFRFIFSAADSMAVVKDQQIPP